MFIGIWNSMTAIFYGSLLSKIWKKYSIHKEVSWLQSKWYRLKSSFFVKANKFLRETTSWVFYEVSISKYFPSNQLFPSTRSVFKKITFPQQLLREIILLDTTNSVKIWFHGIFIKITWYLVKFRFFHIALSCYFHKNFVKAKYLLKKVLRS